MKNILLISFLASLLIACSNNLQMTHKATTYPVQPETLIDFSSEKVSFSISSQNSLQDLTEWLDHDQPTRAELSCTRGDKNCKRAEQVLSSFGVPYKAIGAMDGKNNVTLFYDRIMAHDCNPIASGKHLIPGFGCSVAVNMLQMVSNHQQYVKPKLLGARNASDALRQLDNADRLHLMNSVIRKSK